MRSSFIYALPALVAAFGTAVNGAEPRCRVEQRVIAWSEDGGAALVYQLQTCVTHLPRVSLWSLDPEEGRVGARVEIRGPRAPDDARRGAGDALVAAAGIAVTPLDRAASLPGVLIPHQDPELRERGLMGSPFLSEASAFTPYAGVARAAAGACAASFPCGGLCVYEGHYAPARRWLVCAPGRVDGAAVPLRYVRILPGGENRGPPALDLEKELGRWNGRVLRQQRRDAARSLSELPVETLVVRLDRLALGEVELAEALLTAVATRCTTTVWEAARRFITIRGIPASTRTSVLEGCGPGVGNDDADFMMALATSDDAPMALRVAAGRILGRMRGETPGRLRGKLWRFEPPKEVMDAVKGR